MKYVRIIKIILGAVLIFSGIAKFAYPSKAVNLLLEFKIMPEFLILPVVSVPPVLEILIGVLLVSGMYPKSALISALVLFAGFLIISIYGTIIGLNSDCGCFGSVIKSRIGWGMVLRNGVFLAGAVYVGKERIY